MAWYGQNNQNTLHLTSFVYKHTQYIAFYRYFNISSFSGSLIGRNLNQSEVQFGDTYLCSFEHWSFWYLLKIQNFNRIIIMDELIIRLRHFSVFFWQFLNFIPKCTKVIMVGWIWFWAILKGLTFLFLTLVGAN